MFVLKSSPTFPSVLSITQACAFFGLDCCAYKANIQTLEKIDKPIILHINDKIDKFVLFEKKQNDVITYFDYIQDKRIRIRTDDFLLIWTNILLIPDKKPVAKNMISKKYIFLI
ncbi:MAG: Peptidase family, partial [Bacteroidetes bacterium]|nr:Peptidase family [Bacteroidota bacterium]